MKAYRCDHGSKMEPLGEHCENNWCKLKAMTRAKYADLGELGFFKRQWVRFTAPETQCTDSWQLGTNYISQTYVTVFYKGKEYFKRFGGIRCPS